MQTINRNKQTLSFTDTVIPTPVSFTARKSFLSLLLGLFLVFGMGLQSFSQCTQPTGSIVGASNTTVCNGQGTSVNTNLTGTLPIDGQFNIAVLSGTGTNSTLSFQATNTGSFAVAIPASQLPNATATNVVYRISWLSLSNACGAATSMTGSVDITVEPSPALTATTFTSPVCSGASPSLTVSPSGSVPTTTYNVSVNYNGATGGAGNSTGNVYGTYTDGPLTNGGTTPITVTYTFKAVSDGGTLGCFGPDVVRTVTINPDANAGTITGTSPLCIGSSATYTASGSVLGGGTGTWTSTNPGVATVDPSTGVVTAVSAGTTDITYTITGGCGGTKSAFKTLTVDPNSNSGTVNGTTPLCTGGTATYTVTGANMGGAGTGSWSSTNPAVATVDPTTGVVTAVSGGTTNITYTVTGGCNGPVSSFKTLTVNPVPTINFTAKTPQNTTGATTTAGSPSSITADLCQGNNLTLDGYGSNDPAVRVSYTYTTSGNVTYNGNPVTDQPTPTDVGNPNTYFNTSYGPYGLSSNTSGTITQVFTPYIDMNGNNTLDAGDCTGSPITLNYNVNALPVGTATPSTSSICSGETTSIALGTSNNPAGTTTFTYTASASPNVTGAGTGSGSTIAQTLTNTGTTDGTVTYTITPTSAAGCEGSTFTATVTVKPTPDAIATPSSQTSCTGAAITPIDLTSNVTGTTYTWTRDNTTNVTGIPDGSGNQISGTLTNTTNSAQTVTFTITPTANGCPGPTTTATVTLNDTQAPTFTNCPSDFSQSTDAGQCTAVVTFITPTATDNCPGVTVTQTAGPASGTAFPKGPTTVTFTATDGQGNTATCSFVVTVTDDEDPTITCPADATANTDAGQCYATGVTLGTPTTADNCPGQTAAATFNGNPVTSTTQFPKGTNVVVWIVTDASGNTATCNQNVIVSDTEAPSITCPSSITQANDAGQCSAVVTYTAPVGTDNCPGASTTQIAGLASGAAFPKGVTTNTFRVTDAAGNSTTCSFTVTVNDTEAPVISGCPSDISANTDAGVCTAAVTFANPTFSDNCPIFTSPAFALNNGCGDGTLTFPVGGTYNGIRAIKFGGGGNDLNVHGHGDDVQVTLEVHDAVADTWTLVNTIQTGTGEYFYDGRTITFSTINNVDQIRFTADQNIGCAFHFYSGSATLSNGSISQTAGLPSGSDFPKGTTTNTFTATDASGNTATCSFTVTVTDDEDPTITCPADVNVNTDANECYATNVALGTPTTADNCPGQTAAATFGGSPVTASTQFPKGTNVVTWTVTDASGNTATCTQNVVVADAQNPTITCPSNVTVVANNDGSCTATGVALGTATASDNCPGTLTPTNNAPSAFPQGNTTVTWTVTDASGNTSTCTQTVTVTPYIADVDQPSSQTVCNNSATTAVNFTGNTVNPIYSWTNDTPSIGLAASGTGDIPSFTAVNTGTTPVTATITVTPSTSCAGSTGPSKTFTITVNPTPAVNSANTATTCSDVPLGYTISSAVPSTYTWTVGTITGGITGANACSSSCGNMINDVLHNPSTTSTGTVQYIITPTSTATPNCPGAPYTVTVTVKAGVNGSIVGSSNTETCAGQGASINVILNGIPGFNGSFRIREITNSTGPVFGPATTSNFTALIAGAQAVTIPGSALPNTTGNAKTYRVDFATLKDADSCSANPLLGFVDITVDPLPTIAATGPSSDVCPGSNVVVAVSNPNNVGGTFNWVARDANNNVIGSANNVTYGPTAINTNFGYSSTDCSTIANPITFTLTPVGPGTLFCQGASTTTTANIRDITAPVITCPAAITNLQCASAVPAAYTTVAAFVAGGGAASDNCTSAANMTISSSDVTTAGSCANRFSITRTYTITDGCGNSSTCTQTITVNDQTAPTLTGTAYAGTTGTNACAANAATAAPFNATNAAQGYTDNCSGAVTATLTGTTVTGTDCSWTVTYTFSVADACGNTLTNQTYSNTGSDQTAPTLTGTPYAGTTGTNACVANAATAAPFNATNAAQGYTDNCGGAVTAVLTGTNVTGTDCSWTVTYTFSVKDACNNTLANQSYSNTGSDQTAPTLTGTPYAGTTGTNACVANAATAAPFNATNAAQGYTDNCGGAVTAVLTGTNVTGTDCSWTVTYTFSVKDACNNTLANQSYSNTGSDQTAPTLTGTPYAGTTGTDACVAAATTAAPFNATNAAQGYTDNCGGAVTATLTGTNVTGTDCSWTVTYTFSVKDACNNTLANQSYSNTGSDQTAPTLTGTPYAGTTGTNACMADAATAAPFNATNAAQGYTDNCGGAVTATLTGTNVTGTNCNWTVTYTFSVKDACNNTLANQSYSNTGSDQTAPTLTGTPYAGTTGTNACKANAAAAAPFNATNAAQGYTDNCGGPVTATLTGTNVTGTDCSWTVTYTFSVKDACNNTLANQSYSNTGSDQTAPTLTGTPYAGTTGTNACMADAATAAPFNATNAAQGYTDNCGGPVTATLTGTNVTGTNCSWTVTYTFSVKDACNNTLANRSYSNTGSDQTAPTLTGTPYAGTTGTNACMANATTAAPFNATNAAQGYTDNCGGAVTATLTGTNVTGTDCSWTVTYTFSVKDACNNTLANRTYSNTGGDQTPPALTGTAYAGSTGTNACISNAVTAAPFSTANALQGYTDNCGGTVTATLTNTTVTGTNCAWTVTYTYDLKDACNNTLANRSYSNTGGDFTAPTLTGTPYAGTTGTNACMSAAATAAPFNATNAAQGYTDNCGGPVTATLTNTAVTGTNCSWTVTYTYDVKDACGNTLSGRTYSNTGGDQTAPVLTAPPTQTLNVGAGAGCTVPMPDYRGLVGVSENCSGSVTLVQQAPNAPGSPVIGYGGTRTIVITATDACGNSSTTSFTLNLVDQTPPAANCKNITVNLNASGTASITPAMVNNNSTDNCSAVTLVSVSPSNFNCSNVGPNTVTLTVADASGNQSTCTSTVTVADVTAPVVTCWGDTTIAKGPACTNTFPDLTFRQNSSDVCGIGSVTQSIPAGTIIGASVPSVNLTLTVTDVNGNSSNCSFTVFFTDQTAPTFSNCPANMTVNTGAGNTQCSQVVTWTPPTASDNCTSLGAPTVTSNHNPGETFAEGTTLVTYTATDAAGNSTTCSFTVTVVDNTVPTITCPANVTVFTNSGCTATNVALGTPTTGDNCGVASVTNNHPSTTYPLGVTNVKWTVTDIHGNESSCTQTVTVIDNIAPTITCPANITADTDNGCDATNVNLGIPTTSDNCTVVSVTNNHPSTTYPTGVTTVTWTVTDNSGNTATCTQTVTVSDHVLPLITCPTNVTANANSGCSATGVSLGTPTTSDNCGIASVTNDHPSTTYPVGTTTVTWTVTDVNGNSAICTQTVTVVDATPPTITCPAGQTANTTANVCTAPVPDFRSGATVADNCTATGSLVITQSPAPGTAAPKGVTTVTLTVTDAAGNTASCTTTFTVVDAQAPVFTSCPGNQTPPINSAGCTATFNTPNPTVIDNCGTVASLTWVMSGALTGSSPSTGINYVGTRTFPLGVTTITYTATDDVGNSSTCTFTVTATNTLAGNISGTSTVQQNSSTTSNITFSGTGGTTPYTFTYFVTTNGTPGSNQTITTTGANTITTVPQSNAVTGQYIYTLVSITDANGCTGALPADFRDTITVVTTLPRPDLSPSVPRPLASTFVTTQTREGYVQITNTSANPTTGQVVFRISKVSNFTLNIPPTMSIAASTPVQNSNWTIVNGPFFYEIRSTQPTAIPGNSNIKIGYMLTATGSANSSGIMTVTVLDDTGGNAIGTGDSNNTNNQAVKIFSIN